MGIRLAAAVLAGGMTLAGCGATFSNHGYVPPEEDLELIAVGIDDRESVAQVVGRPSSSGLLTDGGFYYVSDRRRSFGPYAPQVIDREVVAISFAEDGTVSDIARFGLEDGNVIVISRRVTDTNIAGVGFLRQLFGNLGNINFPGLGGGDG